VAAIACHFESTGSILTEPKVPIHSPTVSFPVSPYTRSFRCPTPSPRCVGQLGRRDGTKYPFSKDTRKKKAHSPRPQSQLRTPASHRVYCICCCLLHLCLVPIRPRPVLATLVAVIDSGSRATLSRSICSPQRPLHPSASPLPLDPPCPRPPATLAASRRGLCCP
jgi:hypothetical protein